MTIGAIGRPVETLLGMAIAAIEFGMGFIERQICNRVLEIFAIPTAMAGCAIVIKPGNCLARGMTGAAG